MQINYYVLAGLFLVFVLLLWILLKRNKKDLKELEHDLNMSEMEPEKHEEDDTIR